MVNCINHLIKLIPAKNIAKSQADHNEQKHSDNFIPTKQNGKTDEPGFVEKVFIEKR